MKSLNMYLGPVIDNDDVHFESLLDDDDVFYDPKNDKNLIVDWIKSNYIITGKLSISDDLVADCTGSIIVKNRNIESLANGLFRWGNIRGDFTCSFTQITSLEGAPEKVGGSFYCQECNNLKTLEGAPKEVKRNFSCSNCENLKTLDGAPEEVVRGFYCNGCENLKITNSDRKKYKFM